MLRFLCLLLMLLLLYIFRHQNFDVILAYKERIQKYLEYIFLKIHIRKKTAIYQSRDWIERTENLYVCTYDESKTATCFSVI